MTDELVTFLRARLDEDEQTARNVDDNSAPWPGLWRADGSHALRTYNGWVLAYRQTGEFCPGLVAHWVRHDPAHVLADLAAKRGILDDCGWAVDNGGGRAFVRPVLQRLASVYADHPDYQQDWSPDA